MQCPHKTHPVGVQGFNASVILGVRFLCQLTKLGHSCWLRRKQDNIWLQIAWQLRTAMTTNARKHGDYESSAN